jgi:hypothetical protein
MTSAFAGRFDELSLWRGAVASVVDEWQAFLQQHGLSDDAADAQLSALRGRLASDKLIVAFVAEFSRGKSELINAIFFADTGRRVLPATPGRTTMCPVELAHDAREPTSLSLLPITTRHGRETLAELRGETQAWTSIALDPSRPEQLCAALSEVTSTRRVSIDEARLLGLWDDAHPADNPQADAHGQVEIPAWRHALINYPHPLLRQGLVVLDTPGLNALGAEPELTLGLLPSAHATVFIVGADTGVTKSDMAIWRDHLDRRQGAAFVVLNKIDALRDPLASNDAVAAQIEAQRASTARLLDVAPERVFALSARDALVARVDCDTDAFTASGLASFEAALSAELLPQRQQVLKRLVDDTVMQVQRHATRQVGNIRRELAEETMELRSLRGKSSGKLQQVIQRVEQDALDFEKCHPRLMALRGVHSKLLATTVDSLSAEHLNAELDQMQADIKASMLNLGARKALAATFVRLRARMTQVCTHVLETREMFSGSFARLNAEFGFGLMLAPGADMGRYIEDLDPIERRFMQNLAVGKSLNIVKPTFADQFVRLLSLKLSLVWDNARIDVARWNRAMSIHIEMQLRERQRGFDKRSESLNRIRGASDELEVRIAEIERQDRDAQQQLVQLNALAAALTARAEAEPAPAAPRTSAPVVVLEDAVAAWATRSAGGGPRLVAVRDADSTGGAEGRVERRRSRANFE